MDVDPVVQMTDDSANPSGQHQVLYLTHKEFNHKAQINLGNRILAPELIVHGLQWILTDNGQVSGKMANLF